MDATVADLASSRFWSVAPDDPADAIAEEMVARGHTWAPVLDRGTLVGVVSARDLLQLRAAGHPSDTPAWRVCTYRPLTVPPEMPAADAARAMREAHVHHLLVVSPTGRLVGVLSSLDLLAAEVRGRDTQRD